MRLQWKGSKSGAAGSTLAALHALAQQERSQAPRFEQAPRLRRPTLYRRGDDGGGQVGPSAPYPGMRYRRLAHRPHRRTRKQGLLRGQGSGVDREPPVCDRAKGGASMYRRLFLQVCPPFERLGLPPTPCGQPRPGPVSETVPKPGRKWQGGRPHTSDDGSGALRAGEWTHGARRANPSPASAHQCFFVITGPLSSSPSRPICTDLLLFL